MGFGLFVEEGGGGGAGGRGHTVALRDEEEPVCARGFKVLLSFSLQMCGTLITHTQDVFVRVGRWVDGCV